MEQKYNGIEKRWNNKKNKKIKKLVYLGVPEAHMEILQQ